MLLLLLLLLLWRGVDLIRLVGRADRVEGCGCCSAVGGKVKARFSQRQATKIPEESYRQEGLIVQKTTGAGGTSTVCRTNPRSFAVFEGISPESGTSYTLPHIPKRPGYCGPLCHLLSLLRKLFLPHFFNLGAGVIRFTH